MFVGGCGGCTGTNVGYLTDVSWRNVSMSRGEDLMGMAVRMIEYGRRTRAEEPTVFRHWGQPGKFTG
jgi:hypothetical protein